MESSASSVGKVSHRFYINAIGTDGARIEMWRSALEEAPNANHYELHLGSAFASLRFWRLDRPPLPTQQVDSFYQFCKLHLIPPLPRQSEAPDTRAGGLWRDCQTTCLH
jgi:hypothetical protein